MSKEAAESVKAVVKAGIKKNAVEVRRPADVIRAIDMLAAGESTRKIRRETGFGHDVMVRLKYDHKDAIEVRRLKAADEAEKLAGRYALLGEEKADLLERDEDALKKTNPKDIALSYAIYRDKSSALRGEATTVVAHKRDVSLEDARAAIEAAQKRIRGEAIDV